MQHDVDGITFTAKFDNGYVIRKLFDFLKSSYDRGEMYFMPGGIYGYASNAQMSTYFSIPADTISYYDFSASSGDVYRFGIDFETLMVHLKPITKKRSVTFIKLANDSKRNIQFDENAPIATSINSLNEFGERVMRPGLKCPDTPICSVQAKLYKETLTRPSELKYANTTISVYEKCLAFFATNGVESGDYNAKLGTIIKEDEAPGVILSFNSKVLKSLAKMADVILTDSKLRIWGQDCVCMNDEVIGNVYFLPLMMVQCSIGSYGDISTYIFSSKEQ